MNALNPEVRVTAPSNIALIKYMGKDDPSRNIPAHGSLSMTLSNLCTIAEFHFQPSSVREWNFELAAWTPKELAQATPNGCQSIVPDLGQKGVDRMHAHFSRLLELVDPKPLAGHLKWRAMNTFPAGTGIASSASSFCAATIGFLASTAIRPDEFAKNFQSSPDYRQKLSAWSRQGSGSSCRSLEGPFVYWEKESARTLKTSMPELTDLVCLVSRQTKTVGSSEAHLRVKTSPLWEGRINRVEKRLVQMISALEQGDLKKIALLSWQEAWEMHSLFHTASPPFTYFEARTLEILKWLETTQSLEEPPIVTLDAGPNVHVLVPTEKAQYWKNEIQKTFTSIEILLDKQGNGARLEWFDPVVGDSSKRGHA